MSFRYGFSPPWRRKKAPRLTALEKEIAYWLRATSRRKHDGPFNKRRSGAQRRAERRFIREFSKSVQTGEMETE